MSQAFKLLQPSRPLQHVDIVTTKNTQLVPVLVDLGVDVDFIDSGVVAQLGFEVKAVPSPVQVHAIDDLPLPSISHVTCPVHIIMFGNHHEQI